MVNPVTVIALTIVLLHCCYQRIFKENATYFKICKFGIQ